MKKIIRNEGIKLLKVSAFIFTLLITAFQPGVPQQPDRPNILWIVSEDNSTNPIR